MSDHAPIDFDQFAKAIPDAVAGLRTLSQASAQDMDKGLLELIKVRASQLNGCAYCLQLHNNWARKAGVSQAKLDRVAAWRESPGFEPRERAALAWTEALTNPAHRATMHAAREALYEMFDETQVMRLTVAIATINAWNRIAGPLGFPPPDAA